MRLCFNLESEIFNLQSSIVNLKLFCDTEAK